jgi:hypothetical protein
MATKKKKTESTELALVEEFQVPEVSSNLKDIIEEEMDGLNLSFDRVKVPSGGGLAFEIPTEDGDSDVQKELVGIIVGHGPENVYYASEYTGGNEPPDCVAMDGRVGIGSPGGDCLACPFNEWGSGEDGNGKACQNRRKLFVLQDGELFPLMLALPPTSVKGFSDFIKRNVMKGRRSYEFIAKIGLTKDKSKGGIEYSKCTFGMVALLEGEKKEAARVYAESIKPMIKGFSTEQNIPEEEDFMDEGTDNEEVF